MRSITNLSAVAQIRRWTRLCTAGVLLAMFPGASLAQVAVLPAQPNQSQPTQGQSASTGTAQAKLPTNRDRRKSAKLFIRASKLFAAEKFEEAMQIYEQAEKLDPTNANLPLAAEVARNHALMEAAAKDRLQGDRVAARATLAHALELNPHSVQVQEHVNELGDDALLGQIKPIYQDVASTVGEAEQLSPLTRETHNFHLRTDARQVIQQVYKAYGLETTLDSSVRPNQIRFDLEDANFDQASQALSLVTGTFYTPMDAHRVIVARDTRENRQQFERQELETVYLSGLTATELADVGKLAKDVFDAQQAVVEPSAGTITIRASDNTLRTFNATVAQLLDGRNQVVLDVRMIQVAHTSDRNTGVHPMQSATAYNLYSEEQSILNANQALVQQIISSGLAAPGDTLAIIGILVASGQVSSSLFSNGIATFGGGITSSALAPGTTSMNFNLNTSDSRQLDQVQVHLGDGEDSTVRLGERYPIQTSSFSSPVSSASSIAGLTGAGSSSALSSLLSSLSSAVSTIPMIQYEDLGLTMKTTPKVLRSGDVALSLDFKITALAGTSVNDVPILSNQSYSGVVTLKEGEGVVVASEMDKSQSMAVSGTPGLSEIPGLNNMTGKDAQKNYATLLIIITPHVIRGTQASGHTHMMRVEKNLGPR